MSIREARRVYPELNGPRNYARIFAIQALAENHSIFIVRIRTVNDEAGRWPRVRRRGGEEEGFAT